MMGLNRIVLRLRRVSEWILECSRCSGGCGTGSVAMIISTGLKRRTLVYILEGSIIKSVIATRGYSRGWGLGVAPDAVGRGGVILLTTVWATPTAASRYPWHSGKVKVRGHHCHIWYGWGYAWIRSTMWRSGEVLWRRWSMSLTDVPLSTIIRVLTALGFCILLTSGLCWFLGNKIRNSVTRYLSSYAWYKPDFFGFLYPTISYIYDLDSLRNEYYNSSDKQTIS